jgi:hypothetical protein
MGMVEEAPAVFASGAKSSEEKPRYDLMPLCALRRWAERLDYGARKHGAKNWTLGKDDADYRRDRINHTIEHLLKYANGDRSEDHLGAAMCGIGFECWFDEHATRVVQAE